MSELGESLGVSVFTLDPSGNATLRLGPDGTQDNIQFFNISTSVRNDHDEIAVGADVSPDSSFSVLRLKDGELSIVARPQDGYEFLMPSGLAINNASTVIYQGAFSGGSTLFADAGAVDRRIVGTGDALSGSTVNTLTFCAGGLNEHNQLVFLAHLADGRAGVFVADLNQLCLESSRVRRVIEA